MLGKITGGRVTLTSSPFSIKNKKQLLIDKLVYIYDQLLCTKSAESHLKNQEVIKFAFDYVDTLYTCNVSWDHRYTL